MMIANTVSSFGVNHQQYADDTQLFVFLSPVTQHDSMMRLQSCVSSLSDWFILTGLLSTPTGQKPSALVPLLDLKTLNQLRSFEISDSTFNFAHHIKLLGVTLDCNLNLDRHISNVCSASYFHIQALRHIRPYIDLSNAKSNALRLQWFVRGSTMPMPFFLASQTEIYSTSNEHRRVVTADRSMSPHRTFCCLSTGFLYNSV